MNSIVTVEGRRGANGKRAQSLRHEVRHLWSRLQVALPNPGTQLRIGFCSTHPREGTTSVAANFSIFLGEQGQRTCCIETNLRNPSIADHFQVPRSPGVAEFLHGTADLEAVRRREIAPFVDVVPAGSAPADIYATFGNNAIDSLFDPLAQEAEVLVVDIPPLSTAPEARTLLRSLDGAILVVRAHRTRRQSVEKSVTTFEEIGVSLCGVVLNRFSYDLPPFIDNLL